MTMLFIACSSDNYLLESTATPLAIQEYGNYGARWSINNPSDIGERCFDAVNMKAIIGLGFSDGFPDFDGIYPWSEIKRCNISRKDGTQHIVYENNPGFSLTGSNGDVFVRIPVFNVKHYVIDGYEYRVICKKDGIPHPAFEGYAENDRLYSRADVIPSSNLLPQTFLDMAQARGINYTLYDMRTVDMIFDLIAAEYGCRNTSHIFGHGIAEYKQPMEAGWEPERTWYSKETISGTDCFKGRYRGNNRKMTIGSNICICKGSQQNILTFAKLLKIEDSKSNDYTIYHFDGQPVDLDTDCFIGSCAQSTNWTETCSSPLKWYSGRADMKDQYNVQQRNPMRYRWIENIIGNLWHYLPDITFSDLQMYVCTDMTAYKMHQHDGAYIPVGTPFIENNDNGKQIDKPYCNFWVTSLSNDRVGISFGRQFNQSLSIKTLLEPTITVPKVQPSLHTAEDLTMSSDATCSPTGHG